MRDLFKIADVVKDILQNDENARKNDKYLYYAVCKQLNENVLDQKLGDVLLTFSKQDLPRYESVGRARRKLQAQFPELRPAQEIERGRYERSIDYQKFARGEVR